MENMEANESSDIPDLSETSSSSDSSNGQNHSYNLRSRTRSGSGTRSRSRSRSRTSAQEQGLALNQFISSGLGRLYNILNSSELVRTEDTDESDVEDFWPTFLSRNRLKSQPKKPPQPNPDQVKSLQESDFAFNTQAQMGPDLRQTQRFDVQHSMLGLAMNRELGDVNFHRFGNFSLGAKRQILSDFYLPNAAETVANFGSKVFCGTYSKCGDVFMSAAQDQNIRLYDTSSGEFKYKRSIRARNVGWSVLDVALSPDNCHLIYSSWCDSIHQVSLFHEHDKTEHIALPLRADDEHRFCIFSLRFSANGDEILGGANDGYLYVYDRFAQIRSLRIDGHDDDVNAVAFIDSATHILASGGDDGLIKIWDRRSLRESNPAPVGIFAGHTDGITFIDAKDDERHIISNSKDQSIKLWDLRKFANQQNIEDTRRAVRSQAWDYRWDTGFRCPGFKQGNAIQNEPSIMTYRGHSVFKTLIRCRFSSSHTTGQKFIYTGCGTGSVKVYDSLTGEIVKTLKQHKDCVRDVSWHPYFNEITSSSWDHSVVKWMYREQDVLDEDQLKDNDKVKTCYNRRPKLHFYD